MFLISLRGRYHRQSARSSTETHRLPEPRPERQVTGRATASCRHEQLPHGRQDRFLKRPEQEKSSIYVDNGARRKFDWLFLSPLVARRAQRRRPRRLHHGRPRNRSVSEGSVRRVVEGALLLALLLPSPAWPWPRSESDVFSACRPVGTSWRGTGCGTQPLLVHLSRSSYLDTAWLFEVGARDGSSAGRFPPSPRKTAVLLATSRRRMRSSARGSGPSRSAGPGRAAFVAASASSSGRTSSGLAARCCSLGPSTARERRRRAPRPRVAAATLPRSSVWANLHPASSSRRCWRRSPRGAGRRSSRSSAPPRGAPPRPLAGAAAPRRWQRRRPGPPAVPPPAPRPARAHPVDEFRAATWLLDAPLLIYAAAASRRRSRRAARGARPPSGGGAGRPRRPLGPFGGRLRPRRGAARRGPACTGSAPLPAPAPRGSGVAAAMAAWAVRPRVVGRAAGAPRPVARPRRTAVPLEAHPPSRPTACARGVQRFEIGSYLPFEGYPRFRVFVDDACPPTPRAPTTLLGAPTYARRVGTPPWRA